MKDMFFSQKLADKNSEIMNMYFTLNKKLDNFMDYLDIMLVMNKTSEMVHKIAHISPIDADRFRDYNAIYSYRTKYSTIEGQYINYTDIKAGIKDVLDYILEISNALYDAKQLGEDEDNQDYIEFILSEIQKVREYKKWFILFYDKVEKSLDVGNSIQDIDFRAEDYLPKV